MFYSKGDSKGFHPKGEKVLTEKIQANFFDKAPDAEKNITKLKDVPGAYPNLKQTMMMDQVNDTEKTKLIPQVVGGATLTLETDEDGRSEIVSKINQSHKTKMKIIKNQSKSSKINQHQRKTTENPIKIIKNILKLDRNHEK